MNEEMNESTHIVAHLTLGLIRTWFLRCKVIYSLLNLESLRSHVSCLVIISLALEICAQRDA